MYFLFFLIKNLVEHLKSDYLCRELKTKTTMKKFLISILMMLPLCSFAQRIDKPGEPYEVYYEFSVSFDKKTDAYIHIGGKLVSFKVNGEKMKFATNNDFMNYLSKRGWVMIEYKSSYDWVFKKIVTKDEEIFEHLDIEKQD